MAIKKKSVKVPVLKGRAPSKAEVKNKPTKVITRQASAKVKTATRTKAAPKVFRSNPAAKAGEPTPQPESFNPLKTGHYPPVVMMPQVNHMSQKGCFCQVLFAGTSTRLIPVGKKDPEGKQEFRSQTDQRNVPYWVRVIEGHERQGVGIVIQEGSVTFKGKDSYDTITGSSSEAVIGHKVKFTGGSLSAPAKVIARLDAAQ